MDTMELIYGRPMERGATWGVFGRATADYADSYGGRRRFVAIIGLHKLEGNEYPYFSATGEDLNLRRRGDNRIEATGCLHESIVKWFPEFAPVVHVHLADHRGEPMYAVENAIYWAGLSSWTDTGKQKMSPRGKYDPAELFEVDVEGIEWSPVRLANHLRVPVSQARAIRAYVIDAGGSYREGMRFCLRGLADQWQREADEAAAVIADLIHKNNNNN